MNQNLATTFIAQFDSAKIQQGLAQYFKKEKDEQQKFKQVVTRAVQQKPELLSADRTSLFLACQEAAQDRLLPDGKDGVLTVYNTNVGTKNDPQWVKKVQWQPMIGGLRRKLALHGFLGLSAELVYEHDVNEGNFSYEKGDNPKIVHTPNVFGDRGELVGAYAIVTDTNTGHVYRDSMGITELEMARSKSRNPNGGAWKDWTNEMYRKVMARRLIKQLPLIADEINSMINRDDERNYDFSSKPGPSRVAQQVQEAAQKEASAPIEGEVVQNKKVTKKKKAQAKKAEPEPPVTDPQDPPDSAYEAEGAVEVSEQDPLGL